MFDIIGKYTTARVWIDDLEPSCVAQITQFVNHEAFTNPVAIMVDAHYGKSSCVGFTMPLGEKLIPNVIGVDVGCGLVSARLQRIQQIDFATVDAEIRKAIPFGMNTHKKPVFNIEREFPWAFVSQTGRAFVTEYNRRFSTKHPLPVYTYDWFKARCKDWGIDLHYACNSLGTLGGGNHFIEFGKSDNRTWVVIHSGSRNLGKKVCEYWQDIASKTLAGFDRESYDKELQRIKTTCTGKDISDNIAKLKKRVKNIKRNDLDYLEGANAIGYLVDMLFAQKYAEINRKLMLDTILKIIKNTASETIESVHNYIDMRDFIIRKGAIRSYKDEHMVIPLNMQAGTFICKGLSNAEWNFSAPHGAGRTMSRTQAKKTLDLEKFKTEMSGIFSTSVTASTLDEAPGAYKDPSVIEGCIAPTAKIIDRIVPIFNMKDVG